jgi:hypothetical protein
VTPKRSPFSLESLGCHLHRVDNGWWDIYILVFYPKFPCGINRLFWSSAATSSGWWTLSLAFLPFFLWFITDNWYLSLIVQLLYLWDFFKGKQEVMVLLCNLPARDKTERGWSTRKIVLPAPSHSHPPVHWTCYQEMSSTPSAPSLHCCSGTSQTQTNPSKMLVCTYKKI